MSGVPVQTPFERETAAQRLGAHLDTPTRHICKDTPTPGASAGGHGKFEPFLKTRIELKNWRGVYFPRRLRYL
jgi:hypothetical protein